MSENKDNIVRPQFGKPRADAAPREAAPVPPQPPAEVDKNKQYAELLYNDLVFKRHNDAFLRKCIKRCDDITNYIFDVLNYRKNDASVDLRQGTLAHTTVEAMCRMIDDSTKNDWREKPAFFGAMILELDMRMGVINEAEATLAQKPPKTE